MVVAGRVLVTAYEVIGAAKPGVIGVEHGVRVLGGAHPGTHGGVARVGIEQRGALEADVLAKVQRDDGVEALEHVDARGVDVHLPAVDVDGGDRCATLEHRVIAEYVVDAPVGEALDDDELVIALEEIGETRGAADVHAGAIEVLEPRCSSRTIPRGCHPRR